MPGICQLFSMLKTPNQASIPANSGVENRVWMTYFRQGASAWPSVGSLNHETVTAAANPPTLRYKRYTQGVT